MNCQDGELACPSGKKAKIEITIDNQVENLLFDAPACVKKEEISENPSDNTIKCWKFYGMTNDVITSMHYVCGRKAYYQPDKSLINNGAWLIVDGQVQVGRHYYYWSGTDKNDSSIVYKRFVEPTTKVDGVGFSGNCDMCLKAGCQITVTSQGGASYKSKKGNKCDFQIACDDNCPPGYIKCEHPTYPGYCCLPCKATAEKINNLANKIR